MEFKGCRLPGFESRPDLLLAVKLNLPEPQFPHLLNWDNSHDESVMRIKLEQGLELR